MKKSLAASLLSIALPLGAANGAVVFDSLNNPGLNITIQSVSVDPTAGRSLNFTMPAGSSFDLTSVVLRLGGIADAGVEVPEITVWSNDTATPGTPIGTLLTTLTLSGTLVDGLNTFTSSGLILNPGETYWLVVRNAGEATAEGAFTWNIINSITPPQTGVSSGGALDDNTGTQLDPSTWTSLQSTPHAAQVNASPVPEPSAALLGALGMIGLLRRRR